MVKELSQGQGMGPWVHPIRVAVSGRMEGPGLFEMLYLLGKEKTISFYEFCSLYQNTDNDIEITVNDNLEMQKILDLFITNKV